MKEQNPSAPNSKADAQLDTFAPDQQLPELLPDQWVRTAVRKAVAATMAIWFSFTAMTTVEHTVESAISPAAAESVATCHDGDTSYARIGAKILQMPQDPHIANIEDAVIPLPPHIYPHSTEGQRIYTIGRQTQTEQMREYEATKLGLTVHDPRPFESGLIDIPIVQPLDAAGDVHLQNKPFTSFLGAARRFLALYGVDLSVGTKTYPYGYGGRAPTAADLDTLTAENDVFGLMTAFSAEPVQYPEGIGLKHLILMANKNAGAAAYAGGDTIVLNISDPSDPAVTWHEEGHMDDSLTCQNGTTHDPSFAQLNGSVRYYGNAQPSSPIVYANYLGKTAPMWSTAIVAEEKNKNSAKACATAQAIRVIGRSTVFISEYAGSNVTEDKAELYAQLPDPESEYSTMDPDTPRLERKYELLFGRLYSAMPQVATFFSRLDANAGVEQICPPSIKTQTISNPVKPS